MIASQRPVPAGLHPQAQQQQRSWLSSPSTSVWNEGLPPGTRGCGGGPVQIRTLAAVSEPHSRGSRYAGDRIPARIAREDSSGVVRGIHATAIALVFAATVLIGGTIGLPASAAGEFGASDYPAATSAEYAR